MTKEIINDMTTFGITNYNGYTLKFASQGTFFNAWRYFLYHLYIINIYINENLNNFITATTIETI